MSSSVTTCRATTGDAPGDATRDGTGLMPGEAAGRSGVGIGVRLLRVSVAAAPGTGVGSALNSDEQLASAADVQTTMSTTVQRANTPGSIATGYRR